MVCVGIAQWLCHKVLLSAVLLDCNVCIADTHNCLSVKALIRLQPFAAADLYIQVLATAKLLLL